MTREQAEKEIRDNFTKVWADEIIKVLEQQPEDVISRQAVLDKAFEIKTGEHTSAVVVYAHDIRILPPVKPPKPKTGHWRTVPYEQTIFCSECNCRLDDEQTYLPLNYCPKCGTRMIKSSEDKE